MKDKYIALAGNPNVGKSTVFNALTGLNQHTGNWTGKTVELAEGLKYYKEYAFHFIDLPGTYSLIANSEEEAVATEFLKSESMDVTVVICDATLLERNLNLVLQTISLTKKVIVCLNLMDEANKKNIVIDKQVLSKQLGVPVVCTNARKEEGLNELLEVIHNVVEGNVEFNPIVFDYDFQTSEEMAREMIQKAEMIAKLSSYQLAYRNHHHLDKLITSKWFGIPLMIIMLLSILWITIVGANYPSQLLSDFFAFVSRYLSQGLILLSIPTWLHDLLIHGIYRVVTWVIAVMLPPMAIFFPLFTYLEDLGYLPRIAFNMDRFFRKSKACGKQALTMCMGFGCNAVGVIGCRIIDSPREKLIAILTNNFVPCNGRFPTLITLITLFFVKGVTAGTSSFLSALLLTVLIVFGIGMTLLVSYLLSKTVLKGIPSSFTLELPPFRKPQFIKVLIRSIYDRTIFVLKRAIVVSIPAGLIIWILANVTMNGVTLLSIISNTLDPFAKGIGLDGVILMAFILGFPANEIVIPIILMAYLSSNQLLEVESLQALKSIFLQNGWTILTAMNVMLFSLFHWPCSTTLLTIYKETKSIKWTSLGFLLPTAIAILVCFLTTQIYHLFF